MRVYISGKISGLESAEYIHNFLQAEKRMRGRGVVVVNPIKINPLLNIKSWLCYMIADLIELRKCTHIAMQPNWIDSRGAVIEYYFAKWIFKLKVIFL